MNNNNNNNNNHNSRSSSYNTNTSSSTPSTTISSTSRNGSSTTSTIGSSNSGRTESIAIPQSSKSQKHTASDSNTMNPSSSVGSPLAVDLYSSSYLSDQAEHGPLDDVDSMESLRNLLFTNKSSQSVSRHRAVSDMAYLNRTKKNKSINGVDIEEPILQRSHSSYAVSRPTKAVDSEMRSAILSGAKQLRHSLPQT